MNKKIIKYHNNFSQAIYSLNVTAKKVLLAVILKKNNAAENYIQISRSDFVELVGIDPRQSHQSVEQAVEELMSTIITIKDIDNDTKWRKYQLLTETRYDNGVMQTRIAKDMLPFFDEAQKKFFTKYHIENIKPLKSVYSIRVYELLKQYESLSERTFEIEDLKKILGCEKKYPRFSDFKKRALEVARKELEEKTDIMFNFKTVKNGRTVVKIIFEIAPNYRKKEIPRIVARKNSLDFYNGKKIKIEVGSSEETVTIQGIEKGLNEYVIKVVLPDNSKASVKLKEDKDTVLRWIAQRVCP